MKPYIIRHKDFLTYFNNLSLNQQKQVIPTLNRNHLNTISEVCKNFLNRQLTQDPKIIRRLKRSRKEINSVSLKSVPLYKKRKILQTRKGGAILSILLPLAASLVTSLISKAG